MRRMMVRAVGMAAVLSALGRPSAAEAVVFLGLGDLPSGIFDSAALGVSADGSVVGYGLSAAGQEAFLWDATHGMRRLRDVLIGQGADLTAWRLAIAYGVSADSRTIVGRGVNPPGQTEAWLARLDAEVVVPEPSGLTLVGVGAVVLLGYAWGHRRTAGA